VDELKENLSRVADSILDLRGDSVVFEFTDKHEFPAFLMPEGLSFKDLNEVLSPYIAMRAINEDEIVLNGPRIIEKRHDFSDEEMREIADNNMKLLKRKKEIELEKSIEMKKFSNALQELEAKLYETVDKHTNGYEYRNYDCLEKLNFKDGFKYLVDVNDEDIVHRQEKLKPDEKQMRLEHTFDKSVVQKKGPKKVSDTPKDTKTTEKEEVEKLPEEQDEDKDIGF
jgi:hypothetical protein